jgi:rare lipoprotein A
LSVFRCAGLLAALWLVACTTPPELPSVTPTAEKDGRPPELISAADVADAVPRGEAILAAGNSTPYAVMGKRYKVLDTAAGYSETGRASWYGRKFHGEKTANGEVYDAYAATAAHRTLPIPSYVRVSNLENGRTMLVRVNDRGPFHSERIIDLSYGAAVKLGFDKKGTAPVRVQALEVAGMEDLRNDPAFANWQSDYRFLQVASLGDAGAAQRLHDQLVQVVQVPVEILPVRVGDEARFRVRVGPVAQRDQLLTLRDELKRLGYGAATLLPQ